MIKCVLPCILVVLTVALLIAGCGNGKSGTLASPPMADAGGEVSTAEVSGELNVFVPCGIAGPYGEIKALFEKQHPGLKITQDIANIDVQTKLIEDGKASPDVWFSLGDREVQTVQAAGRLDGEPTTYAFNSVALVVHKNNPCGIESLADLAKPEIKTIALPSAANSSGYYMQQALEKAKVWDNIQDKLVLLDEPAQVKVQLSGGKAEAGAVYYPCSRETRIMGGEPKEMQGKVQLLGKIPAELSGPIPAQAAVIKGCANPAAGHAFVEFLLTDEAQDIWEKWAFDRARQPASGKRTTLYLYCGAGIRPFMDEAIEAFGQERPDVRIDVGYAGSGCLLSQLTFARRGDLYMPGEDFYINQAKERGYTGESKLVGYFEPVIIVQKGNPKGIKALADLVKPGLKVGVGEPEAAAVGRAAEAVLKRAALFDKIQPNIALRAGNVPELGNAVQLKSLDAAIVWNVTAAQVAEKCDSIELPRGIFEPSPIPIAVLKFSEHPDEALAFVEFCAGPTAQRLAAEAGMTPASRPEAPPA